jgi:hypothetical protein
MMLRCSLTSAPGIIKPRVAATEHDQALTADPKARAPFAKVGRPALP